MVLTKSVIPSNLKEKKDSKEVEPTLNKKSGIVDKLEKFKNEMY